jgi:hypothetical protein
MKFENKLSAISDSGESNILPWVTNTFPVFKISLVASIYYTCMVDILPNRPFKGRGIPLKFYKCSPCCLDWNPAINILHGVRSLHSK